MIPVDPLFLLLAAMVYGGALYGLGFAAGKNYLSRYFPSPPPPPKGDYSKKPSNK